MRFAYTCDIALLFNKKKKVNIIIMNLDLFDNMPNYYLFFFCLFACFFTFTYKFLEML